MIQCSLETQDTKLDVLREYNNMKLPIFIGREKT